MDIRSFTNAAIGAGKKHSSNPEKKGKSQNSRSNTANQSTRGLRSDSMNKNFSRNMQASENKPANYKKIEGMRNKRPQTSQQNYPTQTVGKCQFKVVEEPVSDYSANLVPDLPSQYIPNGIFRLKASFDGKKLLSTNSNTTGSTKRHSVAHFNQEGTRTTQYGRHPVDSVDLSRSSLLSVPVSVRKSRTVMKNVSTSVPNIVINDTKQPYTMKVPCQLILSAKDRSSKIHMQNSKINEELRRSMKQNIQRQRKGLNLSMQSYFPQVSLKSNLTSGDRSKKKGLSHSQSVRVVQKDG